MKKKHFYILLALALVLTVAIICGSVYAFMIKRTPQLENNFVPATVSCEVMEEFTSNKKDSITIKNTGTIEAYVRVRLVTYWVDESGNVVSKSSEMPSLNISNDWIAGANNTYYCKAPVAPEAATPNLLTAPITLLTQDGYRQVIDVFAEAIQSLPSSAATQSWGVAIADGKITSAP